MGVERSGEIDGETYDRVGRGNYVFRESTELHSTEELWIVALPRCRCEERAIPSIPVTFSIGPTDKRASERKRDRERGRKRREASATRRRFGEINGAM